MRTTDTRPTPPVSGDDRRIVRLYEIAHARSGDKGNTSTVSLIPFDAAHFDVLERQVTGGRVRAHFGALVEGNVTRYCVPSLPALNFVLEGSLAGGVTRSTTLDRHGKALSYRLLELEVILDETTLNGSRG